jgi:hypothetical protein
MEAPTHEIVPLEGADPLEAPEKGASLCITRKGLSFLQQHSTPSYSHMLICLDPTENLRFLCPYKSHIKKNVKQRQFGCSMKEAYQIDFPSRPIEEYVRLSSHIKRDIYLFSVLF